MTQKEFIKELKKKLFLYLPDVIIAEQIKKYERYFKDGRREGKSEEEQINELGSTSLVAVEIASEYRVELNTKVIIQKFAIFFFSLAVFFALYFFTRYNIYDETLYLFSTVVLCALLYGATFLTFRRVTKLQEDKLTKINIANVIPIALLVALMTAILVGFQSQEAFSFLWIDEPQLIGTAVMYCLNTLMLMFISFWIIAVIYLIKGNLDAILLMLLNVFSIQLIFDLMQMIRTLSNVESVKIAIETAANDFSLKSIQTVLIYSIFNNIGKLKSRRAKNDSPT